MYAQAWTGYLWREENTDIRRDPGDEVFGYAAVGGDVGGLTWKAAFEGTWGRRPVVERIPIESETRRLVEIVPGIGWSRGAVTLEVAAKIDISGRNVPKGPTLSAGAFLPW